MIDVKDLEAFLAILDGGSISRAAEEIGLTQPALSLKLKKMENELGVSLFQRTPRSVVPLEAAKLIAPKARDIILQVEGVKESLAKSIMDLRGQVRVGCVSGWFETLVEPLVSVIREVAPGIRLRLHSNQTDNLIHSVAHGQLDLAIVAQPFEKIDDIETEKILDEELVLIGMSLPQTTSKEARKVELLSRPWICMKIPDPLVDKWWREQFDGSYFPWNEATIAVTNDHITAIPRLLKQLQNSVAVIPKQIVLKPVHSGEINMADSIAGHNELYLIWRTNGLELERYKIIKNKILEQAHIFLQQSRK